MTEPGKASDLEASPLWLAGAALPSLFSFCLFRLVRAMLSSIKAGHTAFRPESSRVWQVFSDEFISKPLVLPLIMTGAPRWNPHAIAAGIGPISVRETISLDLAAARRSAREWFFVFYAHPGRQTVGSLSCLNIGDAVASEFKVPRPGRYAIGARYYHPSANPAFPAITVDGIYVAEAKNAPVQSNAFMAGLAKRDSVLYKCLAYYVYPMLRARRLLAESFVRREFLPVGNPETSFLYGACRRGSRVVCRVDAALLATHDVYVTLYSRSSFPISWHEAGEAGFPAGLPVEADGYYLTRIQRKIQGPRPQTALERSISIELQPHSRLNKAAHAA